MTRLVCLLLCLLGASASFADPERELEFSRRQQLTDVALSGNTDAMVQLGNFYLTNRDARLAGEWYEKAALKGNVLALWKLADFVSSWDRKDYKKLWWCYEQLMLHGEREAYRLLGDLCSEPASPYFNVDRAVLNYRDGAMGGDSLAMMKLAKICLGADKRRPDYEQAVAWFTAAAEKNMPEAMRYLGLCYRYGLGLPKPDFEKTWQWYGRAAQMGDAESLYIIAEALYSGKDIRQDPKLAETYFRRAVACGSRDAEVRMRELAIAPE